MTPVRSTGHDAPIVFVGHSAEMGGAEHYLLDVVRHIDLPSRVVLFDDGPFVDELRAIGASVLVVDAPPAVRAVKKQSGAVAAVVSMAPLIPFIRQLSLAFADAGVVYLNSQKALIAGAPAAKRVRKPAIWNLHDIITAEHFGRLNRRAAVAVANRYASRVVVNSVATRNALIEAGYRGSEIDLVYNGIDTSRFVPADAASRANYRRELGLGDGPVVGLFGRIARWKGQDVLIRSLSAMPDVRGLIVGGALFQDDEAYLTELHALVDRLGIGGRVLFTGTRQDVAGLMAQCDVVVHTSTAAEPFGRVIVEAMLCGVPVIATRAGGASEIVADGVTGLFIEPGSVSGLVEMVRRVLGDARRAHEMAKRAREHAQSRYTIDSMTNGVRRSISLAAGVAE